VAGKKNSPAAGGADEPLPVAASDRLFQVLGGAECDFLAGLDLDGFAGGGVASHPGRPLADLQDAEAVQANALALFQVLGDVFHHLRQQGVDFGLLDGVGLRKRRGKGSEGDRLHFGLCLGWSNPGDAQFDAFHVLPYTSLSGVTDDLENLVIPERYVYSRSLDIKSLTPLQQTRGAWSICHGLCKFSARAAP